MKPKVTKFRPLTRARGRRARRESPASERAPRIVTTHGRPVSRLRTIHEAAELFNTSTRTVRRLIASGALPVHRLGRSVRISDADIAAFLAANRSV
jgi:excisionase family DNA binding protein